MIIKDHWSCGAKGIGTIEIRVKIRMILRDRENVEKIDEIENRWES